MGSGRCWSRCCPGGRSQAARRSGPNGSSLTGSGGGRGWARRGATCRRSTDLGRRSTAVQVTGPSGPVCRRSPAKRRRHPDVAGPDRDPDAAARGPRDTRPGPPPAHFGTRSRKRRKTAITATRLRCDARTSLMGRVRPEDRLIGRPPAAQPHAGCLRHQHRVPTHPATPTRPGRRTSAAPPHRQVRRLANDSAGLGQAGPVGVDPLADGGVVAVAGGAATGGGLGRLARGRT